MLRLHKRALIYLVLMGNFIYAFHFLLRTYSTPFYLLADSQTCRGCIIVFLHYVLKSHDYEFIDDECRFRMELATHSTIPSISTCSSST